MSRLGGAWRALEREQRLAVAAACGLFVSMLLPWYSETVLVPKAAQTSLTAFQDFSFVEAAVLLVSVCVLVLLFGRAEQRSFRLPGGDGAIVIVAGGWCALLIFYRLLSKPGLHGSQRLTTTVGVQWGIFVALLVAIGLIYAGQRMRAAEHERTARPAAEPTARDAPEGRPAGDDDEAHTQVVRRHERAQAAYAGDPANGAERRAAAPPAGAQTQAARRRPRYPPAPGEQMSIEDPPAHG
jgi:hypothetical protein